MNYKNCQLCPRNCKVNRQGGQKGYCGETYRLRISSIGPHYGEEPPISGINGSGTVFFSGCSLQCTFCQNYQISIEGSGKVFTIKDCVAEIKNIYRNYKVHNVNFVTPDHFIPHIIEIVKLLRKENIKIPILFNSSGYQKLSSLKIIENYVDIYMPDFKYSDSKLSKILSNSTDYPEITIKAIKEMVKQKGFLDSFAENKSIATRGVLVRHLILPNNVKNSIDVLTTLFLEFGKEIPLSLMSQYYPPSRLYKINLANKLQFLLGRIHIDEFKKIYEHALSLGFTNMLVQYPQNFKTESDKTDFIPDFSNKNPFKGNK